MNEHEIKMTESEDIQEVRHECKAETGAPGRPRLLTPQDLARLKTLVETQPDLSLRQIGSLMEERRRP